MMLKVGKLSSYFSCSRGVRQGDPLSPLLFCLAEDFLSRLITVKVREGSILPMTYTRHSAFPMHFLYADDVLLFGKASVHNIRAITDTFKLYGQLSGQVVNWEKSEIYFGSCISEARILKLRQVMGIKRALCHSPILVSLYLGEPLNRNFCNLLLIEFAINFRNGKDLHCLWRVV